MRPLRRHGVPLPQFGVRKKLIPRKGKPVQVMRPAIEKPNAGRVYVKETKEEKHSPKETKDYSNTSISKIRELILLLSDSELASIAKNDVRITARKLAMEELKRREG